MELYIVGALVLTLVYLDSMAIYYAIKSDMFEPIQIIFQTIFVIAVPIVGALIILNFALSQGRSTVSSIKPDKTKSRFFELLFLSTVMASYSNKSAMADSDSINDSSVLDNPVDRCGSDSQ